MEGPARCSETKACRTATNPPAAVSAILPSGVCRGRPQLWHRGPATPVPPPHAHATPSHHHSPIHQPMLEREGEGDRAGFGVGEVLVCLEKSCVSAGDSWWFRG